MSRRGDIRELASAEGLGLFAEYVTRERRSWFELLAEFPACRPPLANLLELLPRLRPRAFSIASTSVALVVYPLSMRSASMHAEPAPYASPKIASFAPAFAADAQSPFEYGLMYGQ